MAVDKLSEVKRLKLKRIKELIEINIAKHTSESVEMVYKYLMSDGYDVLLEHEVLRQSSYDNCMRLIHEYGDSAAIDSLKEFQRFINRKFQQ